jgi:hypothetical protein
MFVSIALFAPALARASSFNTSTSVNGGTLSWTVNYYTGQCGPSGQYSYGQYNLTNFQFSYTYVSPIGTSYPVEVNLEDGVSYISGSYGAPYCPANGPEPAGNYAILTDSTGFYRIAFTAQDGGYGTAVMESFASGSVQPKYIVQGVIYAAPGTDSGSQNYVQYAHTTDFGTDTSFNNSFQNSNIQTMGANVFGFGGSLSTDWTQTNDSSGSISINQSSNVSHTYIANQPAGTLGLNHDNDIILLWINPMLDCVAEPAWSYIPGSGSAINCLQYDTNVSQGNANEPNMNVLPISVGWLNFDYSMQADNPALYNTLQQAGITSSMYSAILASDPYGSCGPSISCVQSIGVPAGRFDDDNTQIYFTNNSVGNSFTLAYTQTSAQGTASSFSYAVSYILSGAISFKNIFSESLKEQNTLTWTNKWSQLTQYSTGQTAEAFITAPTSTSGYTGPLSFEAYKDNVYGTFMFYPTN